MTTVVALDLRDRPVLVAGGGPVAARRATALVSQGARVTVVAPQLCEDLVDLVHEDAVVWLDREVAEADVDGTWFVHAATADPQVNRAVCAWATAQRIFSVCASAADLGTARVPATTQHAGLTVAVACTGAPDPGRATAVRDQLAAALTTGSLDLRRRRTTAGQGKVVLIGGGPGAEDLLTVRGRQALFQADVVVTDRLGPTTLLEQLPPDVEVIDVGKAPGRHAVTQTEINRILLEQAQRGRVVARLKGGDPFLFGRGGEEHLALADQGVRVEVVPGVSSALAAPLAAGIPLTHRGTVAAVHVSHGHASLDDQGVAAVVDGTATLVVLMGVTNLARHVDQLLEAGADPEVPVAIVENATLPAQRVTRAPLQHIVSRAADRDVRAPAVIVVGAAAEPGLIGIQP